MATESQNTKRDIGNPVPGGVWAVGNSRITILNRVVREDYTHTERRTSEQCLEGDKGASHAAI